MKQSQHFLENAENCAQLAERAADDAAHNRFKRMETAWRALAAEQDWLEGSAPDKHDDKASRQELIFLWSSGCPPLPADPKGPS